MQRYRLVETFEPFNDYFEPDNPKDGAFMAVDKNGEYVLHSDAQQRIEQLEKALNEITNVWEETVKDDFHVAHRMACIAYAALNPQKVGI